MQDMNAGIMAVVILAAVALVVFLVIRNRKDKKELLPPKAPGDPVEEKRMKQRRDRDKL